jgi:hypothetical protein
MFTLADVLAAIPANSPIIAGDYWDGVLAQAERKVKTFTGRALESASYTDTGHTVPDAVDSAKHVWYLREPTGAALAFSTFSGTLKLNDTAVAEADVTIEAKRLVFATAGDVEVTYSGGYMAGTAAVKAELLQAIIVTMHEIHRAGQEGLKPDFGYVAELLAPYTSYGYDAVGQ